MRARWLCLAALVGSGCIPDRDNLHDSSRTPDVAGAILDTRVDVDTCGTDLGAAWPEVFATTERTCLALTARGSEDPQGSPLAFRYALVTSGVETWIEGDDFRAGVETVALPRSLIVDAPFGVPLAFRIEARDREGAVGRATVPLIKTNTPPIAAVPPRYALPLGGQPWALGDAMSVRFDARSSRDPDGDDLQYCWTAPGAAESCGSASIYETTVPANPARAYAFVLRVFDGSEYSSRSRFVVEVDRMPVWHVGHALHPSADLAFRYADDDQGYVQRIDTSNVVAFDLQQSSPILVETGDSDNFVYFSSDDDSIHVAPLPSVVPTGTFLLGQSFGSVVDGPGSTFWYASLDYAAGATFVAQPFSVSRSGAIASVIAEGPQVSAVAAADEISYGGAVVTSDGSLWMMSDSPGVPLFRFPRSGEAQAIPTEAGYFRELLQARPGRNEVWMLEKPEDGGLGGSRMTKVDGSSSASYELPFPGTSTFTFIDEHELWIYVDFLGLCLVDADALESGAGFEASVLHTVDVQGLITGVADPISGDLWTGTIEGVDPGTALFYRVSTSGTVQSFLVTVTNPFGYPGAKILQTDRTGRLWLQGFQGVDFWAGKAASSRIALEDYQPTDGALPSADPSTGGLWFLRTSLSGSRFDLVDQLGHVIQTIYTLADAGGETRPADGAAIRATPDGERLLVYAYPDVLEVDLLSTSGGTATYATLPFVDATQAEPRFLHPTAPGVPEVFWTWDDVGGVIRGTPRDGAPAATFAMSDPEMAVAPDSGNLCVSTHLVGTTSFELSMVRADGSQDVFDVVGTLANAGNSLPMARVSATTRRDNGEDLCWFSLGDQPYQRFELRAYDESGDLVHRLPIVDAPNSGVPVSIAAVDEHTVWLVIAHGFYFDYTGSRALVEFDPAIGSTTATLTEFPSDVDGFFIPMFGGP